jgi:hypothetical protein
MQSPFNSYIDTAPASQAFPEKEAGLPSPFSPLPAEVSNNDEEEVEDLVLPDYELMEMEEELADESPMWVEGEAFLMNSESTLDLEQPDDEEREDLFLAESDFEEREDDATLAGTDEFEDEGSSRLYSWDAAETAMRSPENTVTPAAFSQWFNATKKLKNKFPNEPETNLDQLPIPSWVDKDAVFSDFKTKHGADAITVIGDATKPVKARYFVIHDTAVTGDYTPARVKGKGVHLWVNAKAPVVLSRDWSEKGQAVKLERGLNHSFVHIELSRDPFLLKEVQKKTGGKKVSYQQFVNTGGVRAFGTYYNDRQYELLAYAYVVASLRKGKFLTVTIHREVDRSVIKRTNGKIKWGHDDPQFFDLDYFYSLVSAVFKIPKATYGIQTERSLAYEQRNLAGFANEFIPFVTGEVQAANQYGPLQKLNPATTKHTIVKLKTGLYYDVTSLKNKLQQPEVENEFSDETPDKARASAPVGVSTTSLPPLICEDVTTPGYTCYVHLPTGRTNKQLNMSGIYTPASFNPGQPVDVLLYLHGMTGTFPGSCAKIPEYWTLAHLPAYDLRIREEVNDSGKNLLLVAPYLGSLPNSKENKNTLSMAKGLDGYLEGILAAANEYVVKRRYQSPPIRFNRVILAAHSAGGMQMRMIATAANPVYGAKIVECWGFDSLYEGPDGWAQWASANKNKKYFLYFKDSIVKVFATNLAVKARSLPNVFIKGSSAGNHFLVPKAHLKECIAKLGQGGLTKVDFEESQFSNYPIWKETSEDLFTNAEDYVSNISNAIRLNNHYADKLGWRQHIYEINDLLLPYSGLTAASLGEEAFAYALAGWQKACGFSDKDSDGVLGPATWKVMKPLLPVPSGSTSTTSTPIEQTEWMASSVLQSRYSTWQLYKSKRDAVISWGIASPVNYIESAINEWNANRGIHHHFEDGFDGVLRGRVISYVGAYLNLKRLYVSQGVADPAAYFARNIVSITFFNKSTPGHRDLKRVLDTAQTNLRAAGHHFAFNDAFSFNPRTFRDNINILSNHAFGKAIDINSNENPLIKNADDILVINAVCGATLTSGFLPETDPVVFKNASDHFRANFTQAWINRQTDAGLIQAIQNRRNTLDSYAVRGFMNLPDVLVRGLQAAGATWGGSWRSHKDFMHFDIP